MEKQQLSKTCKLSQTLEMKGVSHTEANCLRSTWVRVFLLPRRFLNSFVPYGILLKRNLHFHIIRFGDKSHRLRSLELHKIRCINRDSQ